MSLPHPAATSVDEFSPGTRLCRGRFVVQATLGRGGVAIVYRVSTRRQGQLALKVMLEERASDSAQQERFDNESRILQGLAGAPYVPRVFETGRLEHPDSRPYIAMELLRGPTFDRLLHGERVRVQTRIARACRVLRQVADALANLHDRGVVHRDVKPENIVVEHGGTIRLLDFGYSHSAGAGALPDTAGLTRAEHRPGTYLYMAPEQAIGHPPAPSFDVYGLAVTLYEALAGHAPNYQLPVAEMARLKCEAQEPEISIVGRVFGVPPLLEALVDEGLRRLPSERIDSAAEFRDRLDEIIAGLPPESGEELDHAIVRYGETPGLIAPTVSASTIETESAPPPPQNLRIITEPQPNPIEGVGVPVGGVVQARTIGSVRTEVAPAAAGHHAAAVPQTTPTDPSAKFWLIGVFLVLTTLALAWWWVSGPGQGAGVENEQGAAQPRNIHPAVQGQATDEPPSATPLLEPASSETGAAQPDGHQEGTTGEPSDELEEPAAEGSGPSAAEPAATTDSPPAKAPQKRRAKPSLPPCEDPAAPATTAAKARQWNQVLQLTRPSRCWDDRELRLRLRVQALSATGQYDECARVGAKASAPTTQRFAKHCKKQLAEQEPN